MTSLSQYEERIAQILTELRIPESRIRERGLELQREATELVSVGLDISNRERQLAPRAAESWRAMRLAAERDGVVLLLVSAFRSVEYQNGIWQRKLAAGQTVEQILRVSAPPGYSEHHTGRAVDVSTNGCEPLTEEFEGTAAFKWLNERAREFGFSMSFPRDNKYGFAYEPWHWAAGEIE